MAQDLHNLRLGGGATPNPAGPPRGQGTNPANTLTAGGAPPVQQQQRPLQQQREPPSIPPGNGAQQPPMHQPPPVDITPAAQAAKILELEAALADALAHVGASTQDPTASAHPIFNQC